VLQQTLGPEPAIPRCVRAVDIRRQRHGDDKTPAFKPAPVGVHPGFTFSRAVCLPAI
jgi:hypothetical protein